MHMLVGYGEQVITPPLGIDLSGYGYYLDRKGQSVLDNLKARVLFLRYESHSVVMISCDLVGFSVEFSKTLRESIAARFGWPVADILLACTHTHCGPAGLELRSLGEVDADYLNGIGNLIEKAVVAATDDMKPAEFSFHTETIEPIGFNRRTISFEPIDPMLNVGIFKRTDRCIYMLNYACHPVILGPIKEISADWPGRAVASIEKDGDNAIFFQGFCGDIDPVTTANRWGKGTEDDINLYGEIVASRARKATQYAEAVELPLIKSDERQLSLPLDVPAIDDIGAKRQQWLDRYGQEFANADIFFDAWVDQARKQHSRFTAHPFADVSIQGISIGKIKIIGLPGEVFCQYGLTLRKKHAPLFTFGYSGGNIGYLPTKCAFEDPTNYACYNAPKFYSPLFPFTRDLEDIVLCESNSILAKIG